MEHRAVVFFSFLGLSIGVPWVGILKVTVGNTEAGAGIILIKENLAITVANEVSKLNKDIRLSARIYFYREDKLSTCYIMGMKTHPEYEKNVLNTITLIFVKCFSNYWSYIPLPEKNTVYDTNLSAIVLIDQKDGFSEITYNVQKIKKHNCESFYRNEELDYESLWPRNVVCVKANVKYQCIFEAGMPLVHKNRQTWTLVGISTFGPGCSLPSRFILLSPYLPWIERNEQPFSTRRQGNETKTKDPFFSEELDKEDDFVIARLNDSSMVMRTNLSSVTDRHGECNDVDGDIIYKEKGRVEAIGHTAVGTYVLSLYDTFYENITCVLIHVICKRRTPSKLWYDMGFHQESVDHLVQTVPIHIRNQTVPPKIIYKIDSYAIREKFKTANIIFKFEFRNQANISIEFYGRKPPASIAPISDYLD